ncbi:MAG: hypothetical protein ABIC82_07035 [bacterium]
MITDSLSDSKLKWGYWYVTHKLLLRQILTYFLIFINLNLWFFAAFFIFKIYFFDSQHYIFAVNELANSKVNYSTFNQTNQPKQLVFGTIDILKSKNDKYDLFVKIKNPNINWAGRVNGKFIINKSFEDKNSEDEYEYGVVNILGGEEKYFIQTGFDSPNGIGSPQFKINYIQWRRIRNQDVFSSFVKEYSDFDISEIKYTVPAELQFSSLGKVGDLSFAIKNNSSYDYWRVDNKILFKRAGTVVGVDVVPVEEFKIDQRRIVNFRIFDNLTNISSVEVYPEVDIFDKNNVMEELFVEGYLK